MINHESCEVFFDGLEVPSENRIGEEGNGFRYIMSGMNAERILLASESVGDGPNMAKYLASRAAWKAANAAMDTFGGWGMASEYGIERKFREARLYLIAPVANNLVLSHVATHVLGMPRSF